MLWEPYRQLLVFPVYGGEHDLIFWQGRNFSGSGPKYLSRGSSRDILHVLNPGHDTIILTEDLLSAIVVSRITSAMPIWGSHIPLETILRLAKGFKRIGIWLDMDKTKESRRACLRASQLGVDCFTIHTTKDPKCYSKDEVKEILYGRN
jgi:hypothetical protein